jgi:ketosteroid isomerase-like protein
MTEDPLTRSAPVRSGVEVLEAFYDAFNRGNIDAALLWVDVEFEWFPAFGPGLLGSNVYVGHDGFRRYVADLADVFTDYRVDVLSFEEIGNRVVVTNKTIAHGRTSGIAVDQGFTIVYTVRDGRIVHGKTYRDRAEALRVANPS